MDREVKCALVRAAIICARHLDKTFGNCSIGLALVEAYYCLDNLKRRQGREVIARTISPGHHLVTVLGSNEPDTTGTRPGQT